MKKQWIILMLPVLMAACNQEAKKEEPFRLSGEIAAYEAEWVHLLKREQGQFITMDSTMAEEGQFAFNGTLEFPMLAYLKLEGVQRYVSFFLEPGETAIIIDSDDPVNPVVKGSESHQIYQAFLDESKLLDSKMSDVYAAYTEAQKADNKQLMEELEEQYNGIEQGKKDHIVRYIKAHSGSVVAAFIALRNLYQLELDELEEITAGIEPAITTSSYVVDLNQHIERLRNVQIGKTAPDFIMNDTLGNPVALSSFFGNYLFLDFWAAWCGPCRAANPNKVAAFEKFHNKGVEYFGVSLDTDRERWIKAIHDDGLTWNHVSDLAGWGNEAAGLYAVNSIPSNVLLDPDGIIIARNLKGEDLHKKLEEVLGAPIAAE
ncbi:MAG TPA: AhpC/TSA family protein [Bacteroidales bacterium]|nr:AhpC/TSA family protein [Bacteroidales bacterium]